MNKLTPLVLIPLFTKAYLKIGNVENGVNDFKSVGIWLCDSNIFGEQLRKEVMTRPMTLFV